MRLKNCVTRLTNYRLISRPACAAVCYPQAILTYTPRAILHAGTIDLQWIGIAKSSVALAKDRSRSLPGRAVAMSVWKKSTCLIGRPLPANGAALVIAVMITIAVVTRSTRILA